MSTSLSEALTGVNADPMPAEPALEPDQQAAPEAEAPAVADVPADPPAAPETPAEPDQNLVPVAALQAERDKARYWQEVAQQSNQTQPQPEPEAWDFIADPEGASNAVRGEMQQAMAQMRAEMSQTYAVNTHGADKVQAAAQWAQQQGGAVLAAINADRDPYGKAVQAYDRAQAMQKIGGDPEAFMERTRAEIRAEIMKEMEAQKTVQQVKAPPGSLAGQTSAGDRVPGWQGPTSLDDIFR